VAQQATARQAQRPQQHAPLQLSRGRSTSADGEVAVVLLHAPGSAAASALKLGGVPAKGAGGGGGWVPAAAAAAGAAAGKAAHRGVRFGPQGGEPGEGGAASRQLPAVRLGGARTPSRGSEAGAPVPLAMQRRGRTTADEAAAAAAAAAGRVGGRRGTWEEQQHELVVADELDEIQAF
jgi:hypothetical protein